MSLDLDDAAAEFARFSVLLSDGLAAMRTYAEELAQAEHDYRLSKATAWLHAPEGTVPQREAWVNGHTADKRRARDLAEAMSRAALEAVRSRRTQISALQTLLNAHQEEAKFVRTGQAA